MRFSSAGVIRGVIFSIFTSSISVWWVKNDIIPACIRGFGQRGIMHSFTPFDKIKSEKKGKNFKNSLWVLTN
ncbi:hypothetical protein [Moraxella lacunata]|uniref:hypothetical protein n=1 Tax=Moraxella lacunata TaxID=477 RepID=UPI003EE09577